MTIPAIRSTGEMSFEHEYMTLPITSLVPLEILRASVKVRREYARRVSSVR